MAPLSMLTARPADGQDGTAADPMRPGYTAQSQTAEICPRRGVIGWPATKTPADPFPVPRVIGSSRGTP